jgi:hypothetical protein
MTRKQVTTRKKVKVIGQETYINPKTGELKDMQVIDIEERDFNFHKVWLQHILNSIDLIGNKKTKLAFWIIENLNKENQFIMTYRKIVEKTGFSIDTVKATMTALVESNFLVRVQTGVYIINPDVLFKGGKSDRANILLQYHSAKHEEEKPVIEEKDPQPDPPKQEKPTPNISTVGRRVA